MAKTCRHSKAFPTIYAHSLGYCWCPCCGAIRQIEVVPGTNGFTYSEPRWVKPGKQYLRAMEVNEKARKRKRA